jgi:hypothetical protein
MSAAETARSRWWESAPTATKTTMPTKSTARS